MAESVKPSVAKQVARIALRLSVPVGVVWEALDFFAGKPAGHADEAERLEKYLRSQESFDQTMGRKLGMHRIPPKDAKAKGGKVKKVMKEYKKGQLKPVRKRKQAIAIDLSSYRKRKKK